MTGVLFSQLLQNRWYRTGSRLSLGQQEISLVLSGTLQDKKLCVCVCMCVCTLDQDWDGRYSDLLRASSLSCCSSYKECVYFFSSISPANSFSNKVAESFCNWFHPFCCRWSKLGLLVLISSLPELFSGEQVVSFFLFSITRQRQVNQLYIPSLFYF